MGRAEGRRAGGARRSAGRGLRTGLGFAALGVAGMLALSGCASPTPNPDTAEAGLSGVKIISDGSSGRFKGTELPVPLKMPSGTFTDTSGASVVWPAGSHPYPVTLVLFGYTSCPDECPTQLADAAAAIRGLPADQRAKVGLVMVDVDPKTDTRQVIRTYLDQFNPEFIGLRTDNVALLTSTANALGVVLEPEESTDQGSTGQGSTDQAQASDDGHDHAHTHAAGDGHSEGHGVGHGVQLLGVGTDGRVHVQWNLGTPVADLRSDIQVLLSGADVG